MQYVESQLMFRRNISPPSSGSNKPSKITTCFHTGILLALFNAADEGEMFLQNVTFNRLYGVISQKTVLFITTAL
jgi:hypothetical protein